MNYQSIRQLKTLQIIAFRDLEAGELREFSYSEESGNGQMEVAIRFESHPVPANQQVEWHFGETVLNAGQSIQQRQEEEQEGNEDTVKSITV